MTNKKATEKSKTTMDLPRDLWVRLRVLALEQGRPAKALVVEALEAYLKKGGR